MDVTGHSLQTFQDLPQKISNTITAWSFSSLNQAVGNGRNTKIIGPKWVDGGEISFEDQAIPSQSPKLEWISDLNYNNTTWNEEVLIRWFGQQKAKCIQAIHIPSFDCDDEYIWLHSKYGIYTQKSGYWEIMSRNGNNYVPTLFWKQNLWPKWKIFYWKLANGALATRVNLRKKKILSEAPCAFCGQEEESDTHLFKDCEISRRIWASSELGLINLDKCKDSIAIWTRNWIWYFMQNDTPEKDHVQEFVGILWSIWISRNNAIFRSKNNLDPKVVFTILNEWKKRNKDTQEMSIKEAGQKISLCIQRKQDTLIWSYNWTVQVTWYTLLIDGAWKGISTRNRHPGIAAYGWVLKKGREEVAKGGHIINASSADQAEALALLNSLKEMLTRNILGLEVWTDSKVLVEGLREENKMLPSTKNISLDIKSLGKSFNFIKVCKVDRNKIAQAHSIATTARKVGTRL
ncbi:uncharacterized protein LOC109134694 [Beta vulgaris subsp. vulgaris]|uniref:uncharacterized protein LOC109134694 n=1 Tax=Beta vulgaris subsp. vulgaris TaxID=3555 RepID=UPI000901F376|nr:uncharacterized protein LOC109134694 [Beta vulgaris subsp. vulgaris]